MNRYITESKSGKPTLTANPDFVQSFYIPLRKQKALHEGYVVREYDKDTDEQRKVIMKILRFLAKFRFATRNQIERFLSMEKVSFDNVCVNEKENMGLVDEDIDTLGLLLNTLSARQTLNYFCLAECELPEVPENAEKIYCLNWGAMYILANFWKEDFVYWRNTDNARSCDQIIKSLATVEFFLNLYLNKAKSVRVFEPNFTLQLQTRNTKVSSYIEMRNDDDTTRAFVLDTLRSTDLPSNFREKTVDRFGQFLTKGYYKKLAPIPPEFIFLCEDMAGAKEAAEIFYRAFEKDNYFVTTYDEIEKGFKKASFFRIEGEELIEGQVSSFV